MTWSVRRVFVCVGIVGGILLNGRPSAAQSDYTVTDLGVAAPLDATQRPEPYRCYADCDQVLTNQNGQIAMAVPGPNIFAVYYWEPGMSARTQIQTNEDAVRLAAISSNGYVTGTSDGGVQEPFVWSKTAGMFAMFGPDFYYPLAVNAQGMVVGTQQAAGFRAVLWNYHTSKSVYLDDLNIEGKQVWAFQQAQAIDDAGRISGVGLLTTSAGTTETHFFLLTPVSNGGMDRSDWTVMATEASPTDPPKNAIDGNLATRWSTGDPQHDSQGFFVSWPGDRTVGRIRMEVGPSTGDYPRMVGIWVKDSAGNVTYVPCQADASGIVDVSFTPTPVARVEVWQWGTAGSWWSIAEFDAFQQ
jgi:hypothetical protein